MTRRLLPVLLALVALAAAPAAATAAGAAPSYRACPPAFSDPANGVAAIAVERMTCRAGLSLARRTNSVRCFLNGTSCTHRHAGRWWRCALVSEGTRVRCVNGRRKLRYRAG